MPRIHYLDSLFTTGYGPCHGPLRKPTVIAAKSPYYIAMSIPALLGTIPSLQDDISNWAVFAMRFQEAMEAMNRLGHFDGTTICPVPKDTAHPTNTEKQAIKEWEQEDRAARYHLSRQLPDCIFIGLIDHKMAKARWDGLTKELGQPELEDTRTEEGLTGEPPAVTGQGGSRRRQRRGQATAVERRATAPLIVALRRRRR